MAAREGNPARGGENRKRGVEIGMQNSDNNPWLLESSDQPGMVLISIVLTGNNFLSWSRFMSIALGAKGKLGFVNGEIKAPDETSPDYRQWKQTDCMVFCWIINSLSEEIMHASLFANTAKDLWDNLAKRYGGYNFPLIYEKKVEIAKVRQGSDTVTEYYTKLEKLWSELGNLKTTAKNETEQLMQFLMGLASSFDHARQQILLFDPLPSVYHTYMAMFLVEEKRNARHEIFAEPVEIKLHGYPADWFKNPKEQKGKYVANEDETPVDLNGEVADDDTSEMVAVAKSILNALRKYGGDDGNAFADFVEYSGAEQ